MSQNERILRYFKSGGTLTSLEALELFGCMRLGARVFDLKREGHDIRAMNEGRKGKHWTRYFMPVTPQMELFL